jgi:hypothetical protein
MSIYALRAPQGSYRQHKETPPAENLAYRGGSTRMVRAVARRWNGFLHSRRCGARACSGLRVSLSIGCAIPSEPNRAMIAGYSMRDGERG